MVGVGEAGESLAEVELALAVTYRGESLEEALREVRQWVDAAAAGRIGTRLVRVDIAGVGEGTDA
ncbi:hypothetical protein SAMN05421810_103417 [Amycolatopsis arida]|uniref:Uncharacterized protein n=1 Tax=Amycolatopsis arida TaxID=587909 RepID=A0A1I5T7A3_9PSEU|nr:hypothetical protein CLV69_103341 [Amycolatopsis arida]SFP78848.1 hypothetical protein SAMN05421810_103417 [Amycolatopsis arida]